MLTTLGRLFAILSAYTVNSTAKINQNGRVEKSSNDDTLKPWLHIHTHVYTDMYTYTHIQTASQQAQGECHTVAWRLASISANCQHIAGMQNSWAGAKRTGARTRWSYPSKKDTKNMAPFPMSQEAQHSIGKEHGNAEDIILFFFFSRSQDVHLSFFMPVQTHFLIRSNYVVVRV